ncbi:MAG TPA: DUF748 domain-containing protein [Candidatus Acidoferrales bacterium]|nr:DUF748 domain-containing protein [Candidatus Acidoferrales bacterium]
MTARHREPARLRKRRLLLWVCGLVLLYAVIGFLILPPIVRRVAVSQIARQLDREVTIKQVKINPFTLSTTIRGLRVNDPDGEPFISWDELYVNFQLSSFFGHAWVFKEISLSKPFLRAQMNQDYTFNFSDLITRFSTNAPAAAPATPPKPVELHIGRLHIGGAEAALADFTPRQPFKRRLGPIDITLDNFRTDPASKNPYSFAGTTDAGETISWNGFFSLAPLRSEGELKLFNFDLNKYAPLYQDLVRFQVRGGSIALETKYRLAFSATNRVAAVEDLAWSLRDFKLGEPGESNNLVEVPLFALTGGDVDLQNHVATLDSVVLDGAQAFLKRNTNAAINVVELSKPAESPTNAPGGILFLLRSVTNAVALLLNSTNEWTATVHNINFTNCSLHLEDDAAPRPARLELSDISLDAKNLSNLPGTNLEADFSLRWNTNAAIHIGADVGFQPTTADIQLDLDRLDLTTLDAYLASKLDLFILGSEVNLHGVVRLRPQINDLPVVSFTGDASLDHFRTVDGVFGQDLVKWDVLSFNGMVANLNPPLLAIHEILLSDAYARVIVETNGTINLANVLSPADGATTVATNQARAAAANSESATNQPMQISIGAVVVNNTAVDFSDRSLQPNVNLALQSINGSVSDLSTERLHHAIVNVNARVDGVGPVAITGIINPLKSGQTNDLKISVKNVDLTPASPYAGKFAGYGIAEGKLNLDLDYRIIGKKIAAKNVVTLDQFTFGERVNSPEATHLPVRLAVAILKDRDGKIVLDVPIEGSLDDPKFRIGKVVTRAIVNILEKVATSPFSLLGAAFGGGGEELGWQDFSPGSAQLTPEDTKKLDLLAKALQARPALKLQIAGSIDPTGDREGLQRAALDQEIRERKWAKLRRREQTTGSADQLVLTPADRSYYIAKLYAEAFAAKKITPQLIAANTNLAAYAAEAEARRPSIKKGASLLVFRQPATLANTGAAPPPATKLVPPPDPMEALLLATFPISDADFQALAARRAQAAQAYLLQEGKVEAGRLFVAASGTASLRRDGSRAYLQFQ